MRNIQDLVPKHKGDDSGIPELKQLSEEEIAPVLPALLEWIQDGNWPVFEDVLSLLVTHQNRLYPRVLELLKPEEQDHGWKYWIMARLLPNFSEENKKKVLASVERIAAHPTEEEKINEIAMQATEFLEEFFPDSAVLSTGGKSPS